jgi:phage tail-like protein
MAQSAISRFSKLATDPLRNFRFIVEFRTTSDGGTNDFTSFTGGFTSVSGLRITNQPMSYREGGMNTTLHQVPGMTAFDPITLSRGVILGSSQGINWMKKLFAATSGQGIANSDGTSFRCDLDIYVLDHPVTGAPNITTGDIISNSAYKMKFTVHNAWVQQLSFTDLSATDNQLLYETLTLIHEGLSVELAPAGGTVPATQTATTA